MSSNQVADAIQWIAYSLILVFLAQVITSLFPLALLQPQWMVRVSTALRGTASLPLLALGLFMLAGLIDEEVLPSGRQLKLMRQIATYAAIGFLLLVPLQSYGLVRSINNQVQESQAQLNKLAAAANQIQQATTEQQLRQAIREIPGGEQIANRPLGADLQTIKTGLLGRLRPTVKRLENQLKDNQNQALQNTVGPLVRDGLISLAYALGFAGIGGSSQAKPTLLRRLLKPRNPSLRKLQVSNRPGLANGSEMM
ncbi:MAG: HpsJ family protein [Cyanobacteriota bacterium]